MFWLLLAALAAAAAPLLSSGCASKKKVPPRTVSLADDKTECESMKSKPSHTSSNQSTESSELLAKKSKKATQDELSEMWKAGKTILSDPSEEDNLPKEVVLLKKGTTKNKKIPDKKKPPPPVPPPPTKPAAAPAKPHPRPQQPKQPISDPETESSAPVDKPLVKPAPDNGIYESIMGLDESKKKTVRRIKRPPSAYEMAPRGRTPMCQPSPINTPPVDKIQAAQLPSEKDAKEPSVQDVDPTKMELTARTNVSLLVTHIGQPHAATLVPSAPSPVPLVMQCAPMASLPAAAPTAAAVVVTTPPAPSPGVKHNDKTQPDSPVRPKF